LRSIPVELLENLVEKLGVNPAYFFDKTQPMFLWEFHTDVPMPSDFRHLLKSQASDSDNQIICIPIANYDSRKNGGIESLPVHKRLIAPYDIENVKAFRVDGMAMAPTLKDGDYAMFVGDHIKGDGLYVVDTPLGNSIRRLFFKLDGTVEARYDAPDSPVESFSITPSKSAHIVGQIIGWFTKV
jgi:hypothetical protein